MTENKPLDIAEFNREMIAHLMRGQDKMKNRMDWLDKELRLLKEFIKAAYPQFNNEENENV